MRHHLDGNARAADAHYDQPDEIGNEDGETCNRCEQPSEENPNPKPCNGVMYFEEIDDEFPYCDTCGEIGE